MAIVDDRTGRVVGGDELDNDYSRCILPPSLADPYQSAGSPKHDT